MPSKWNLEQDFKLLSRYTFVNSIYPPSSPGGRKASTVVPQLSLFFACFLAVPQDMLIVATDSW